MSIAINGFVIDEATEFQFAPNPKRVHAKVWHRYDAYSKATNIEEYRTISIENDGHERNIMPSLRYDEAHGYLKFYNAEGELINEHLE